MTYLDYNSTTPALPEVVEAMNLFHTDKWHNSSSVYKEASAAQDAIKLAQEQCAALVTCKPNEIIFTSGATEGNQTILRQFQASKKTVLTTAVEHSSVLNLFDNPRKNRHVISVDTSGIVDIDKIGEQLQDTTGGLVSVILANNETGVLSPIEEVSALCCQIKFLIS